MADSTRRVELGARLRQLRRRRGLSQEQLAEAVGVSAQVVHNWERGHTGLPAEELPSIAASLGVTIGDLYEESEERSATLAKLEALHAELRRALELDPERIQINVYVAGASQGQSEAVSDAALVPGPPDSGKSAALIGAITGLTFARHVLQEWPAMSEEERHEWRELAEAITRHKPGDTANPPPHASARR